MIRRTDVHHNESTDNEECVNAESPGRGEESRFETGVKVHNHERCVSPEDLDIQKSDWRIGAVDETTVRGNFEAGVTWVHRE